ncbi:MAG: hypothetical protein AAF488_05965 [Planctomycetota bacterium]
MQRIDDLFLALLQKRHLDAAEEATRRKGDLDASFDLDRVFQDLYTVESWNLEECGANLPALTQPLPVELRRLYFYRFIVANVVAVHRADETYEQLEPAIPEGDVAARCLFDTCRIADRWLSHAGSDVVGELESVLETLASEPRSVSMAYVESMVHHSLGYAFKHSGNFKEAESHFGLAADIANFYEFYTKHIYRSAFAKLCWASGQYRKALELHSDGEARRHARETRDHTFLIDSHLCTAKCAIDLGALSKVEEELEQARDLLSTMELRSASLPIYLDLYQAQLKVRRGEFEAGRRELEACAQQFATLSPPSHQGKLDAEIELVALDLEQAEYIRGFRRIASLLDEAERRGVMDARTRLLAFQARLYLDRSAPLDLLRSGYDNLVERLQLMNNPRLTFLAYADLFAFAREHLDAAEQRRWLGRIRALDTVLERSCYETLYRDYVTERYRSELERDLTGLDFDLDVQSEEDGDSVSMPR